MQGQETSVFAVEADSRYNGLKDVTEDEITEDSSVDESNDGDSEPTTNEGTLQSAKAFWAETLCDVPELAIHAIPVERHGIFTVASKNTIVIDGVSLEKFAEFLGVTVNAVVYTAWGLVLDRHSQASSNTVVVGAETLGQDYPLKLQLKPSLLVSESLQSTNRLALAAASNAFLGFETIRGEHAAASADFKIAVASPSQGSEDVVLHHNDNFPVCIQISLDSTIYITARHDTAIPEDNVQILLEQFTTALKNIMENPLEPLSSISIVSDSEQSFLLEMAKPQAEPVYENVQDIFERQVELTPAAPALQFEDGKPLSYSELNAAANRVARRLPSARGSLVPVCLQRSVNLVVTILAILKTGAAYVVLDPETPQERNSFIVEDVDADFVIVDRSTEGRFHCDEFIIENIVEGSRRARDTNLGRRCDPSDAVYVIYTSGSTGKPKGVLHVSLVPVRLLL